ncbi:MAG TPA: ROK family protein, partial [Agromyces sp.]|nr:ROK family protein [Agromyces sp.]
MATDHAIGIDIGGTGIKGAVVDLGTGELVSERLKVRTPEGGKPSDILEATEELLSGIADESSDGRKLPLGLCFPAVVKHGRTLSAANISDEWIGLPAEELFEN